jgi:hypothetical protein
VGALLAAAGCATEQGPGVRDLLRLWREAGWGWALWNLRGSFGVVDSGRRDVAYERLDGHELDAAMLELFLEDGELRRQWSADTSSRSTSR